jgi:Holliday junction resolvasome RuvABC DNA-binding subunit
MAGPLSRASRDLLSRALAEAEQALAAGHRHIAEQRARIETLKRMGHDPAQVEQLLVTLMKAQALDEDQCVRLRAALAVGRKP